MGPVYAFLHIPKCAGTSFGDQIRRRMSPERYLDLYEKMGHQARRNAALSLDPTRAESLRIVFGHDVYDGVHEDLARSGRYLTVLRDPLERLVSQYNFMIDYWVMKPKRPEILSDNPYHPDGRRMSFEEWVERYPYVHNIMTGYFSHSFIAYIEYGAPITTERFRQVLSRLEAFYYVGLSERFDLEGQYFFGLIGLKNYRMVRKNVSYPHYRLTDPHLRARLLRLNNLDAELYERGVALNRKMRFRRAYYTYAPLYHIRRIAHRRLYDAYQNFKLTE